MRPVEGMSVVVTGGGSGIGAATAVHFARAGALVTICGRREDKLAETAATAGEGCAWIKADVTVAEDRKALVDTAVAHGGGIDVLVNNAGNMYRTAIGTFDEERLLSLFSDNVVSAMMLTQAALPHLEARRGAVIFLGSVYTRRSYPGAAPYAATKGALEALTGVLATELGPRGIRVGCVRPGAVFTEINQRAGIWDDDDALQRLQSMAGHHALGRIGTPEEIAEGIEYLARAEWTTGETLAVDGGLGLGVIVD